MRKFNSVNELAAAVEGDAKLQSDLQQDPAGTLRRLAQPAYVNDKAVYRIVVFALGLAILISLLGSIYLSNGASTEIPEILMALGSASVGALAGLLAPSPGNGGGG